MNRKNMKSLFSAFAALAALGGFPAAFFRERIRVPFRFSDDRLNEQALQNAKAKRERKNHARLELVRRGELKMVGT